MRAGLAHAFFAYQGAPERSPQSACRHFPAAMVRSAQLLTPTELGVQPGCEFDPRGAFVVHTSAQLGPLIKALRLFAATHPGMPCAIRVALLPPSERMLDTSTTRLIEFTHAVVESANKQ